MKAMKCDRCKKYYDTDTLDWLGRQLQITIKGTGKE